MNTKIYYNTTNLKGSNLYEKLQKAGSQKKQVYLIFLTLNRPLSASQVFDIFTFHSPLTPITSIRRAISVLKKEGVLEITDKKVIGKHKDPEKLYKLVRK